MRNWLQSDRLWLIPAWGLGGLIALTLGLVVGFQLYAPGVVREFNAAIAQTSNNTLIYDKDDHLIATVEGQQDRHSVPITRISPYLQKAVVAIEDRRFFAHRGLDPIRLFGAAWADLRAMGYEQGGSTITQQLVKLTLLSPERTITRKIREMFMAIALENAYPKLKLLEFYLNRVYLGNGVYGVEKAAQAYFHTSAAKLDLSQAALLAALIKKPEGYLTPPPGSPPDSGPTLPLAELKPLMERHEQVLHNLAELGWITPDDLHQALTEPLVVYRPEPALRSAPYFVQEVLKRLRDSLGVRRVSGKGYRVYTTLDSTAQRAAEQLVSNVPQRDPDAHQGALIALDPFSGAVRALVGGVDYKASQFNRATQALRQPGSAFKPILYSAALEHDFRPNMVFLDEPVRYSWDPTGHYQELAPSPVPAADQPVLTDPTDQTNPDGQGDADAPDSDQVYTPHNYDNHYGLPALRQGERVAADRRMTLTRALELSSNVIAVQLLDKLGMQPLVRLARRWGVPVRQKNGLCVALGCSEVSLADLTAAYAAFANGGLRVHPVYIRKVTNSDGDVLYEHTPDPPVEVITPWTAFQMRHLLAGVIQRGTGWRARLNRPAGGKTGTNDGPRDAWFVGFTPSLVAGVWVGNDDNAVMPREWGGRSPAEVWRSFMNEALPPYNGETFPQPPDSYVAVQVCNVDGRLDYPGCPDSSVDYFRDSEYNQDLFNQGIAGAVTTEPADTVRPHPGEVSAEPVNPDNPRLFTQRLQQAFTGPLPEAASSPAGTPPGKAKAPAPPGTAGAGQAAPTVPSAPQAPSLPGFGTAPPALPGGPRSSASASASPVAQ